MYRIALVMIVRNEARCIARCLRGVRPWVDEMIVLDTGSTDDTVALAVAEGAHVQTFSWAEDFSLARNAALALSSADWNLVLDADETLASGGEALQALRQQMPDFLGRIEVRSDCAIQGGRTSQTASSWLPRLLPRGVRYQGTIHEQPVCPLPRRDMSIVALHDGYLPEQMDIKGDRNRQLLEATVRRLPADPYWRYQLGKDHEVHDRFEAASEAYGAALQQLKAGQQPHAKDPSPRDPPWRHDLVLRALYALKSVGKLNEAIDLAESEMPNWPDSPDFFFVLGDVLLDFAASQPQQADDLVPMIRSAWERCLEIGENPTLEGAVHGRGSHLARHNLDALRETLGA
jgi:glycosyltransferase involved in cell wall biosynthesis